MKTYLRNSILATLAYYDCLDLPLTTLETYKYLINPARICRIEGGISDINIDDVSEELDKLTSSKVVGEKNSFYFLAGRNDLYSLRTKRQKVADQKWKKFLRCLKFLALSPYLRGVLASGSMAVGNTEDESDFDVLVIAKSGRLYTCRFFLWLITSLLGVRRKPHDKIAPDKFCFNHYISDASLNISHESLFNAQTYVNLKPAMIEPEMVDKFYAANLWLNNYVFNFKVQKNFVRRNIDSPKFFHFFAASAESIFNSFIGDGLENILKHFQQKKIKNNPATYQSGGRVIFTDQELEFHPCSFEKTVLVRYNSRLKKLGIIPYIEERDSGLTP